MGPGSPDGGIDRTPMPHRAPSRRTLLRGAAAGTATVLSAAELRGDADRGGAVHLPLTGVTVVMTAPGRRRIAHGPGEVLPATRIAACATTADHRTLSAEEDAVRAAVEATPILPDLATLLPHARDLLQQAALDLHVLDAGLPAPVASWAPPWRHVWPRDAAHVAVAWSRLGVMERAEQIVRTLASFAGPDGWFEARYAPGTTTAPDDRERQLDGTGWFLWALAELASHGSPLCEEGAVAAAAERCTHLLRELTGNGHRLPPASPDYWEVPEHHPTIATTALVAAGLESATRLQLAGASEPAAHRLRGIIEREYGRSGFGRYPRRHGADAGMLFLLPPYAAEPTGEAVVALEGLERRLARPAGGIAPGEHWRRDGISWTPQTAMLAQAHAAQGDHAQAARLLTWLGSHRTSAGSLPEKVRATGEPASVAPLGWSAALVVATLSVPAR